MRVHTLAYRQVIQAKAYTKPRFFINWTVLIRCFEMPTPTKLELTCPL